MATRIAFAAWSGLSALLLAAEGHRVVLRLFGDGDGLVAAGITGLLNLGWYEVGFVIGHSLRRAVLFELIPWFGIAAGLLPAVALLRPEWFGRAAMAASAVALGFGGLALAVVVLRAVRGFPDTWRLVALGVFVTVHAAWAVQLLLARKPAFAPFPALDA